MQLSAELQAFGKQQWSFVVYFNLGGNKTMTELWEEPEKGVLVQISVPHDVAGELAGQVLQVPIVNRNLIVSILFEDSYDTHLFAECWYKCRIFLQWSYIELHLAVIPVI